MFKFNGFSEKANEALNRAVENACELGHTYIGSEHILLGIANTEGCFAQSVLKNHGIDEEKIEQIIIETIGQGMKTNLTPDDMTPRAKHILQLAVQCAHECGSQIVATEHMLLAILAEGSNYATRFIAEMGVSPEALIDELSTASSDADMPTANKNSKTPNLDKFGRDLTALAKNKKLDPVIGRANEIERVIQILTRRTKNNPCLIGEPGGGKTAIAEGLALKIVEGEVPELLKDKRVVTLDLTGMLAGTKYRGDFEERIKDAIDEVIKSGNTILLLTNFIL